MCPNLYEYHIRGAGPRHLKISIRTNQTIKWFLHKCILLASNPNLENNLLSYFHKRTSIQTNFKSYPSKILKVMYLVATCLPRNRKVFKTICFVWCLMFNFYVRYKESFICCIVSIHSDWRQVIALFDP